MSSNIINQIEELKKDIRRRESTTQPSNVVADAVNKLSLWDRAMAFKDIADTQIEFIVPGLVTKGESTMLTGDFASFKSYLTYFFADAISEGGLFAGRLTQEHPVLILDRENSKGTISLRRYLVGNLRDKTNVRILGRLTPGGAPEITDKELLNLCETVHPFIIIDSMQDFHKGQSENNPDEMTEFFQNVNALIDRGAVGVLIIHHVPKSGNSKGKMYRGSTGIPGGVTGGALFIEKIGATGVKLTGFKTRDGEDAAIELELEFPTDAASKDKTGRITCKVIASGLSGTEQVDAAIVAQVRLDNTKGKHPSASQVAKEIHAKKAVVLHRIDTLIADGRISRDGERYEGLLIPEPVMFPATQIN